MLCELQCGRENITMADVNSAKNDKNNRSLIGFSAYNTLRHFIF